MLKIHKSSLFEKDVKSLIKKHYKFDKLFIVIELLKNNEKLSNKYRNHYLQNNWQDYQECHIEKDLLLIYPN